VWINHLQTSGSRLRVVTTACTLTALFVDWANAATGAACGGIRAAVLGREELRHQLKAEGLARICGAESLRNVYRTARRDLWHWD